MNKSKRSENTSLYISAVVFVLGMTFSGVIWGHAPNLEDALFFTTIAVLVLALEIKEAIKENTDYVRLSKENTRFNRTTKSF